MSIRRLSAISRTRGNQTRPREQITSKLRQFNDKNELDLLVIGAELLAYSYLRANYHSLLGGGATGAGAALDAAMRGLKVLCIEKEDFASGTSSRSTKLIWGGSRYLVQAFASLLNHDFRLLKSPISTIKTFISDFKLVLNCHRERKFLLHTQSHLTNWVPIAVPITKWILWPPPFGLYLGSLGPLGLFPLFFKFYDALCGFSCPPSHIMTPSRAKRKFPQLDNETIKYCSIFYEGMHDDARTNLAIALTAADEGATMVNYMEAVDFIHENNSGTKIIGAVLKDSVTGAEHTIYAKSILFCGGPYTDNIRNLESKSGSTSSIIRGTSGIHIVLPSYYSPSNFGLVDMSTSDGRFLFYLPWLGHVLVGTTDTKCKPEESPTPNESEIIWLLNEASRYMSPELRVRREDVLSAWSGIRPLAVDTGSSTTNIIGGKEVISRDHVIKFNAATGTTYIAGGKWTTYREMAEEAVDSIITTNKLHCSKSSKTISKVLAGGDGYTPNLHIKLIQNYKIDGKIAERLARAYGGRASEVLDIAVNEDKMKLLAPGYPYIEAEVIYCCRHEWALHVTDILARRTRLAFLNKDMACKAMPIVLGLMAKELQWNEQQVSNERKYCDQYMKQFIGGSPA